MGDPHAHHHAAKEGGKDHSVSRILTGAAIGVGVIGAGIMLAPHILPELGYSLASPEEAALMIHNEPMGLAGSLNNMLSMVPFIGDKLAAGGLFTAGASAVTGIAGVLLGDYVASKESDNKSIKWGSVIKWGALATSALIALPAILSAISTGIIYIGMALADANIITSDFANTIIEKVSTTFGGIGGTYTHNMFGLEGIGAVVPHLVCCGAPFAPALVSWSKGLLKGKAKAGAMLAASDAPVVMSMEPSPPLEAGVPVQVRLKLTHNDGTPVTPEELAVVHTEKLHLFVADTSLRDYQHIHPRPTGEPGIFAFMFVPRESGDYAAWADFTMLRDGRNQRLKIEMPSASGRRIAPVIRPSSHVEKDGLQFDWQSGPLRQGGDTMVEVRVSDANGNPVTDLEPVMGAYAHLVGFSADGQSLIHTHPVGPEPAVPEDRGGPVMQFHVAPDCSGPVQFYLQVKRGGQEVFAPFGQYVRPPVQETTRLAPARAAHAGSHAAMGL